MPVFSRFEGVTIYIILKSISNCSIPPLGAGKIDKWPYTVIFRDTDTAILNAHYYNCNDHLPPHFHARFGGTDASIDIGTWRIKGKIEWKKLQIVLEWARRNEEALMANWNRTRMNEDPLWIDY